VLYLSVEVASNSIEPAASHRLRFATLVSEIVRRDETGVGKVPESQWLKKGALEKVKRKS